MVTVYQAHIESHASNMWSCPASSQLTTLVMAENFMNMVAHTTAQDCNGDFDMTVIKDS